VDRQLKKVVKQDEFKEQVWHSVDFVKAHLEEIKKYGGIALAVVVVAGGIYFYIRHQSEAREQALSQAFRIEAAGVGPNGDGSAIHYNTQEEKDAAAEKAFAQVASTYPGTQEGAIALMNLGQAASDKGNLALSEKDYKTVVDSAPAPYASQAALSLVQIYQIENKDGEAEKLLENLDKHPTLSVSSEEAELMLARIIAKTDKDRALKMLDKLRGSKRASISKAAVSATGEVLGQNN
jgi:predicted negative regulator of RcsB-dependent stress response